MSEIIATAGSGLDIGQRGPEQLGCFWSSSRWEVMNECSWEEADRSEIGLGSRKMRAVCCWILFGINDTIAPLTGASWCLLLLMDCSVIVTMLSAYEYVILFNFRWRFVNWVYYFIDKLVSWEVGVASGEIK